MVSDSGSQNRERSFFKGLKREARNCQKRGVNRVQCPRGIIIDEDGQKDMVAYCSDRYADKQFSIGSQLSLEVSGVF